ncbi:MAG: type II toxin-antitoxin system HicA family toxin [Caldisericia bacterium]|nr:type II toxin-antitoxin system HicA family toxin [Caldisericia bacterium]
MKRLKLINKLLSMGCILVRHGKAHDWYSNPKTKQSQPVPRHSEINEYLASNIIKKLS